MAGLPRGRLGSGGLHDNTGQMSLNGEEALGQSCYAVGNVDRRVIFHARGGDVESRCRKGLIRGERGGLFSPSLESWHYGASQRDAFYTFSSRSKMDIASGTLSVPITVPIRELVQARRRKRDTRNRGETRSSRGT